MVKLRNGKYRMEKSGLSCFDYLSNYNKNTHMTNNRGLDIVAVWKMTIETQMVLVDEFFLHRAAPEYLDPTWTEPSEIMTLKELEEIIGHPFTIIEEEDDTNE